MVEVIEFEKEGVTVNLNESIARKAEVTGSGNAASNKLEDKVMNIEHIVGSNFNDLLIGNDENNYIEGLDGDDSIRGEGGNDIITAGLGKNTINAGSGDDLIIASYGHEIIDGGDGIDSITYRYSNGGVSINLKNGYCARSYADGDSISNIENVEASEYDDEVHDNERDNLIVTNDGNDKIYLSDGRDVVFAGNDEDTIHILGSGNKFLAGGHGDDRFAFDAAFRTDGRFGSIISDFEIHNLKEKIDLSAFTRIKSFDDLKITDVRVLAKDVDLSDILKNSHEDMTKKINLAVIDILENQKISLWGIETIELGTDNYIFAEQDDEKLEIEDGQFKTEDL